MASNNGTNTGFNPSKKTITGYKPATIYAMELRINTAFKEILAKNSLKPESEQMTEEEVLFEAHKKAFMEVKNVISYTIEEARMIILHHYFNSSQQLNEEMNGKISAIISNHPVFSDCIPTSSMDNYSVRIDGRMYCPSKAGSGHCKIVDECIKDVMKTVYPTIHEFVNTISKEEKIALLQSTIPYVKYEQSQRLRAEKCDYSETVFKPVMSFSSAETLKGYAIRQSMPYVLHLIIQKGEAQKPMSESPDENA